MKMFISHAEKDREIVDSFVELLFCMGMTKDNLFYSSDPELGVPNGENIYDYIKNMFDNELYVIFMLSENYYKSIPCLNEMGAVWVKQNKYLAFLLPGFEFQEVKGAIDPRKISIKLDDDLDVVKARLNNLKDDLEKIFGCSISISRWEKIRDEFLNKRKLENIITLGDNVATYCIGDEKRAGCELFLCNKTRIGVRIDFSKTISDICSTVVFPVLENWVTLYQKNSSIVFEISATNGMQDMILEIKNSTRQRQYRFNLNDTFHKISIPLKHICDDKGFWKSIREICFLVGRENVKETTTLNIKNIRVES